MMDEREKYRRDNPRTYGVVDINERNRLWMLRDEAKERIRYKKEEAESIATQGASKPWETNPFMRVPMVPRQLWMTGSTAEEKMEIKRQLAEKAKKKDEKKPASAKKDGDGKQAAIAAPKKSFEVERADKKAKAFLDAYTYNGPLDVAALEDTSASSAPARPAAP